MQPRTVFDEVEDELRRAQQLHPPAHSGHEGWAIIKEEMDELWEAVRLKQSTPGRTDKMRREAIQVAAMALRFLIEMDGFQN